MFLLSFALARTRARTIAGGWRDPGDFYLLPPRRIHLNVCIRRRCDGNPARGAHASGLIFTRKRHSHRTIGVHRNLRSDLFTLLSHHGYLTVFDGTEVARVVTV